MEMESPARDFTAFSWNGALNKVRKERRRKRKKERRKRKKERKNRNRRKINKRKERKKKRRMTMRSPISTILMVSKIWPLTEPRKGYKRKKN